MPPAVHHALPISWPSISRHQSKTAQKLLFLQKAALRQTTPLPCSKRQTQRRNGRHGDVAHTIANVARTMQQ